ncbi:transposase [Streptomyces halstedii]
MSAISTRGRMLFMVFTEHFTAEVVCRFLDRLAGHFDHKVHLVVDGHSAHRSKKVRDWFAAHPDDVELHCLRVWQEAGVTHGSDNQWAPHLYSSNRTGSSFADPPTGQ